MTIRTVILAFTAFITTCLFLAFVCWCGGFNFDHRDADVGFGVAVAGFLGGLVAATVVAVRSQTSSDKTP